MPDVTIIGGGPIGLTCALLLAQRGIASCVLDGRPLIEAGRDQRLLALSRGTWQILEPLLGAHRPPRAAIREVHVSSAGEFGATRIRARDFDDADLGATVLYGDLLDRLAAAAATQPLIKIRRPVRAQGTRQLADAVDVQFDDGDVLRSELVIDAEGRIRSDQTPTPATWAIVADLRLRTPSAPAMAGVAYERFTREGPLALLPTPKSLGHAPDQAYALVWCMSETAAAARMARSEPEFNAELQAVLGGRIGTVTVIGTWRAVALPQQMREQVQAHRIVALGNAAQTLHPVAGQGFNLGVRDCVTLADEVAQTMDDVPGALARYAGRRRLDRTAIAAATRWLPELFATRFAPVALARSIGLTALGLAAAPRRQLASLLMFGVRR